MEKVPAEMMREFVRSQKFTSTDEVMTAMKNMSDNRKNSKKDEVPIWFKPTLSIEETSRYSGIGMSKLYELTNPEDCPFVLWIGTRRMIKRRKFDEYIERVYSI